LYPTSPFISSPKDLTNDERLAREVVASRRQISSFELDVKREYEIELGSVGIQAIKIVKQRRI
jgi:hypothetical protein